MTGSAMPIAIEHRAERLVVEGLRRYMSGYSTGDIRCWEMAWQLYASELGPDRARKPVSELSCYARALNAHGTRHLCLFPYDCIKLCQDECLVTALVAACQSNDESVVETIGAALVTPEGLDETLFSAREFGSALSACGLRMQSIDPASLTLDDCPLKKFGALRRH